jgi:hypothetical protein
VLSYRGLWYRGGTGFRRV